MARRQTSFYDQWSTGTKLLLLLSAALLPLGLVIAWTARSAIEDTRDAVDSVRSDDARQIARSLEALVARHVLALRVASRSVIGVRTDPCRAVSAALAGAPGVMTDFTLRDASGEQLCTAGTFDGSDDRRPVRDGELRLWVEEGPPAVDFRVGLDGGSATGELSSVQLLSAARAVTPNIESLSISDGTRSIELIGVDGDNASRRVVARDIRIGNGQLRVDVALPTSSVGITQRLPILLPILMWFLAAVLSWLVVRKLLINPLARLQRAVSEYQPGPDRLVLPERLGSAHEIRDLGSSFERAVDRIEESEQQMAEALAGQRRLVREVHHRVKNNLQVIASLLNIHGRSATTPESAAAYAAIGRRVDALSVVHRNHFAEVEESRGIALRPLLVELAAILRASSPDKDRQIAIQLDVDPLHTTQDAAVAVAFFVTEVTEYSMLLNPTARVDIDLRRVSELAAVLTISSDALVSEGKESQQQALERIQFERVVGGLARQLRSPLDDKIGRLGVNLPVFPD